MKFCVKFFRCFLNTSSIIIPYYNRLVHLVQLNSKKKIITHDEDLLKVNCQQGEMMPS